MLVKMFLLRGSDDEWLNLCFQEIRWFFRNQPKTSYHFFLGLAFFLEKREVSSIFIATIKCSFLDWLFRLKYIRFFLLKKISHLFKTNKLKSHFLPSILIDKIKTSSKSKYTSSLTTKKNPFKSLFLKIMIFSLRTAVFNVDK